MNRSNMFAVALAALVALVPMQTAYSSVPVPLNMDPQNPPTLAPIIKKVANSVVSIAIRAAASQQDPLDEPALRQFLGLPDMPRPKETFTAGSGVIIDGTKGYIVTNYHLVNNADQITVTLLDGRQATATLEGADPDTDIAVIKVPLNDLSSIPFGDSERLEVGDYVLAIGNPFGIGQTVTSGIVSGLRRTGMGLEGYEDFIQTDASINPGNSGGALVDLRGRLVGINAAILGTSGSNAGIGFAIPISMVRSVADQLIKYGTVDRGELGFAIAPLNPELAKKSRVATGQTGAVIARIDPNSPAQHAGLKPGDVVTQVGDMPVHDAPDLRNKIAMLRVGEVAEFAILRDGKPMRVKATLAEPSLKTVDGAMLSSLLAGALIADTGAKTQKTGAQVATVDSSSNAWRSGLREGDIIVSVNRKRVIGAEEFATEIAKSPNRLVMDIVRNDQTILLTITASESSKPKAEH